MKKNIYQRLLLHVVLVLLALIVIIPFYMILTNSLKDERGALSLGMNLPVHWQIANFVKVIQSGGILRGYMNSLIISIGSLLIINICASLAAFSIQRNNSRLTNGIYSIFILGLVMPVSIVPTIKLMQELHVHNTYPGMMLFYAAVLLPFAIFLMTGYTKTIPKELDESAIMDGCGPIRLFYSIIFPLLRPAIITTSLLIVVFIWNDFMGPFYLLSDPSKWTVILTVFNYVSQYHSNWNLVFADILIVILPVLIAYFLAQDFIVEGMTAGAIKG